MTDPVFRPPPATRAPEYAVEVHRDVLIPTADPDVHLSADLHLPVADAPVPAVVTVWPYRKDIGMAEIALGWFAERGYATILVDALGTGSSDGPPRKPFDPAEADDGVAAIEWAAAQEWCTGKVGMWGHSYGAIMSLRTAARCPAHLRAIVPFEAVIDPELELWHPGGARGGITLAAWGTMTLAQQLLPPLRNPHDPVAQRRWRDRLRTLEPWILDLFHHGPGDPVWRDRTIDASRITVPTLCVGGWADLMCAGTVSAFDLISAPKRLIMGPWAHALPEESPAGAISLLAVTLRWWDHWLRDHDTGMMDEPPVSLFVRGDTPGWLGFESWPPSKSELALAITDQGSLAEQDVADAPRAAAWVGHLPPDSTVGSLSGSWWLGHPGTTLDQHDDDTRSLAAATEPTTVPVLVAGRPEVTVRFVDGEPDTRPRRLTIRLADVAPDGVSRFITAGVAAVLPDTSEQRITLWPAAHRLAPGHRLRLVLSEADFPRLWPVAPALPACISRISLVVPTVDSVEGRHIDMPEPAAPTPSTAGPVVVSADRGWRTARDHIHDRLEVVVKEEVAAYTPQREALIRLRQEVSARVDNGDPSAALMHAANTIAAQLRTGENVEVEVTTRMTSTGLVITGQVCIDAHTVFTRTWDSWDFEPTFMEV